MRVRNLSVTAHYSLPLGIVTCDSLAVSQNAIDSNEGQCIFMNRQYYSCKNLAFIDHTQYITTNVNIYKCLFEFDYVTIS